jgi:hypothetical protein
MRYSHWPTLFISSLALLTCPLQGQTPAQPSDPASSLTQPQALALQPITADWRATARNAWMVPYGLGVGKLVNVGQALVDFSGTFYGNATTPTDMPTWSMSFQVTLVFPEGSK